MRDAKFQPEGTQQSAYLDRHAEIKSVQCHNRSEGTAAEIFPHSCLKISTSLKLFIGFMAIY